ncbi:MAG: hypothetical protein R2766_07075 [Saprospiraceae bacterium]
MNNLKNQLALLIFVILLNTLHVGRLSSQTCFDEYQVFIEQCLSRDSDVEAAFYAKVHVGSPGDTYSLSINDEFGDELVKKEFTLNSQLVLSGTIQFVVSSQNNLFFHLEGSNCIEEIEKAISFIPPYQVKKRDVDCRGINTGSVRIEGSQDYPFSVVWEDGEVGLTREYLKAGTYRFTVYTSTTCPVQDEVVIAPYVKLTASIVGMGVDCAGNADNVLRLSVSGGVQPYTYDWDIDGVGDFDDKSIIQGVNSGYYSAQVKDAYDCVATSEIDAQFENSGPISTNDVMINAVEKMPSGMAKYNLLNSLDPENGDLDNDGKNGATLDVSFYISMFNAVNQHAPLETTLITQPNQEVFARVQANDGCYDIAQIQLGDNDFCLYVSEACDNSDPVLLQPVECNTSLTPLPSGGIYSIFKKVNGTLIPDNNLLVQINGDWYLDPFDHEGNFEVHYTYNDGIQDVTKVALFDIQSLNPQIIIQQDTICGNQPILEIRANPIGGRIVGEGIVDSLIFGTNKFYIVNPSLLTPGLTHYYSYLYSQTNESGLICKELELDSIYVSEYPDIEIETSINNYCELSDVSLVTNNVNNYPSLSYVWYDPLNNVISTNQNADVNDIVNQGDYKVVATAQNGCFDEEVISLTINPLPKLACDVEGAVTCPGGSNGTATANVLDVVDVSNYEFLWSNGSTGQSQYNLEAGIYNVKVITDLGCVDSCDIVISEPPTFDINCSYDKIQPLCYGTPTGQNTIDVLDGGQAPYQFSLDLINYSDNPVLTDLSSGMHTVYVRDANGCIDSCSFDMGQPDLLSCNAVEVQSVSCNGNSDGAAEAVGSGGVSPYTYFWDNGETTKIAIALSSGNHSVTVYDANLCESICDVVIVEPTILTCSIDLSSDPSCIGLSDGVATVNPEGGKLPYRYLWDNNETTAKAKYLNAGEHTVTVTDGNNCTTTCNVSLQDPLGLDANPESKSVCNGGIYVIKSNASANVVNSKWAFANNPGTATGVILENVEKKDVTVNTTYATPGSVNLMYRGSNSNNCNVERFSTINVMASPNAGQDEYLTICNLDPLEYNVNLFNTLSAGSDLTGTWVQVSGTAIDISDPTQVDFECKELGNYVFNYTVQNAECESNEANIYIAVESCFDLALRKTVFSSPPYQEGGIITFLIEVFNQGDVAAEEIEVTDYIQTNFIFDENENTIFETGNLANWETSGSNATIKVGTIAPGQKRDVYLRLKVVDSPSSYDLYNYAEITNYAVRKSDNTRVYLPVDQDDTVIDHLEIDNDIADDSNGSIDNPQDDDQYDGAEVVLCDGIVHELACNNLVNISLDGQCSVFITPAMLLESEVNSSYTITIKDSDGQVIDNPVTSDYVGQTLVVTVADNCGGNSCWSSVTIEDYLGPEINCLDDVYFNCFQTGHSFTMPTAYDYCEGYVPVFVTSDVTTQLECDDDYIAVRTITFYAEDSHGNPSKTCTTRYYYSKIDYSELEMPADRHFECSESSTWDVNGNFYPDPIEAGLPSYDGTDIGTINANGELINHTYCNLVASYTDTRFDNCGKTFKVVRLWTVLDWCNSSYHQFTQTLYVDDTRVPIISCSPDIYNLKADHYSCTANWNVVDPIVIFECHETHYEVAYLNADDFGNPPVDGIYIDDNVQVYGTGYVITDLPIGKTWIKYTVYDECGNISECFTEVEVVDEVPPIPVCDQNTVVSINSTGKGRIYSETFDDGSHDNCGDVRFAVRRMNSNPCVVDPQKQIVAYYEGLPYYDFENFCCADLDKGDIQVQLLVIDESGNMNTCMVNVRVTLKIEPILTCPADTILDCDGDYSVDAIGKATYTAVCDIYTIKYVDNETELTCGEKNISRVWQLVNSSSGVLIKSCTQSIRLVNSTPFNLSTVKFPPNVTLKNQCETGLDLSPDNPNTGGYPVWPSDACSQVQYSYEDHTFSVVDDACMKIIRDWTVIDWCVYNPFAPSLGGIVQFSQIIKVIDTDGPEMVCETLTYEADENCKAHVIASADASDICTPKDELYWSYLLDTDGDGFYEKLVENQSTYTADLSVGTHTVQWVVEDRCGNSKSCIQSIVVVDKTPPIPYCYNELATVIMQTSQSIEIWAKDYDLGAYDNCSSAPLTFTFGGYPRYFNQVHYFKTDAQGNSVAASLADYQAGLAQKWDPVQHSSSRLFTCEQTGVQTIPIWVYDEYRNGNQCHVLIDIQDNGNCNNSELSIAGRISNRDGQPFDQTTVYLNSDLPEFPKVTNTDNEGAFAFDQLIEGESYTVKPYNNDDPSNGVSTLDLVLIQRHILGLSSFTDMKDYIAADANNSQTISAADLIQLRKLILGLNSEFPSNTSWRFVPESATLTQNNVFDFDDSYGIYQMDESIENADFIAIKVGDVNHSVNLSSRNNSDTRSNNTLNLMVDNVQFNGNESVYIPIFASDFVSMYGIQFSMHFDNEIRVLSMQSGVLKLNDANYTIKDNTLKLSWENASELVSFDDKSPLFYIELVANHNTYLYGNVQMSSDIDGELVDENLEAQDLELNITNPSDSYQNLVVSQNIPNPFSGKTTVTYQLPNDGVINIKVTSILGQELENISFYQWKGTHEYVFDNELHNADSGILLLTISDGINSNTIRMLTIK